MCGLLGLSGGGSKDCGVTVEARMDLGAFDYLKPTDQQMKAMDKARAAARVYAEALEALVPAGEDRDHILRELRTVAMWVNVAITRRGDGSPRGE